HRGRARAGAYRRTGDRRRRHGPGDARRRGVPRRTAAVAVGDRHLRQRPSGPGTHRGRRAAGAEGPGDRRRRHPRQARPRAVPARRHPPRRRPARMRGGRRRAQRDRGRTGRRNGRDRGDIDLPTRASGRRPARLVAGRPGGRRPRAGAPAPYPAMTTGPVATHTAPHRPWSHQQRRNVFWPVAGLVAATMCALVVVGLGTGDLPTSTVATATVLAMIPVVLVVGVFLWLDRWEPEPGRMLLAAFVWGAGV